jgi:pyridoxal/pyridoxine/pyridoxamine kinase
LGWIIKGDTVITACEKTANAIYGILEDTKEKDSKELILIQAIPFLVLSKSFIVLECD